MVGTTVFLKLLLSKKSKNLFKGELQETEVIANVVQNKKFSRENIKQKTNKNKQTAKFLQQNAYLNFIINLGYFLC